MDSITRQEAELFVLFLKVILGFDLALSNRMRKREMLKHNLFIYFGRIIYLFIERRNAETCSQ